MTSTQTWRFALVALFAMFATWSVPMLYAANVGVAPTPGGDFSTVHQGWLTGLAGGQNQRFINGLTAHAGGGQSAALRLPPNYAIYQVDTVASSGDSVSLMKCTPPFNFQVINNGANSLNIFGLLNSSDTINGVLGSTAFAVPPGGIATLVCAEPGGWVVSNLNGISSGGIIVKVRFAASTNDTISTSDYFICPFNGSALSNETLPASPPTGLTFLIKDCLGNASNDSISIIPASGTIDGSSSFVLNTNYQSIAVTYNGVQWSAN